MSKFEKIIDNITGVFLYLLFPMLILLGIRLIRLLIKLALNLYYDAKFHF